jgi:O-antigen ligase/tetratricopeptide (TPR) repeat protein
LAFLGVWVFTLLAYGGLSPAALGITLLGLSLLHVGGALLLPEPLRLSRLHWVFLACFAGLALLELLPVGPALFPVTHRLRQDHGIRGLWPGTADLFYTSLALAQFGCYVLSGLFVLRLRQSGLGASLVLRGFVAILVLEAAYACVQVFGGLKEIPFYGPRVNDSASGTLVGRNNFAGLMAVGLVLSAALAWGRFSWPLRKGEDEGKPHWLRGLESGLGWGLAAALLSVALLLSKSRGGALSALGGLLLVPFIFRGRASAGGAFGLLAIVLGGVALVGLEPLLARFTTLDPYDLGANIRSKLTASTVQAALHQPVLGFGLGTHPQAYHPFQPPSLAGQVHHAHNEYVNLFFEVGAVGVAILLGMMLLWFVRAWRASGSLPGPDRLWNCAAVGAVAAVAFHSLVDFDLRITSNGILLASLVALGGQAARDGSPRRMASWGAAAAGLLLGALVLGVRNPAVWADQALAAGDPARREEICRRALAVSPYDYRLAWFYARAAQRRGDALEADRRFERAADLWPADLALQREAGLYFWEAGQAGLSRAARCLNRAFEQDPEEVSRVMEEIWPEHRPTPDYLALLPEEPLCHAVFAAFLVRKGETTLGAQVFERGCPDTAAQAPAYDLFAAALGEAGQWGIQALILDRRLKAKSDASAYAASATAWFKLGAFDRALEQAKFACRIDPGRADWHALLAAVLRAKGERLAAAESYSEALVLSPMNLDYRGARGGTYLELRMFEPALKDFQEVLRSRPQDRGVILGLAQAMAGVGKTDAARILLEDYLRKAPEDAEAEALRKSLPPP